MLWKYYENVVNVGSIWIQLKTEKHCSKIIFKCVNSTVWPIFNEKVTEKWNLWVCEQCTDPHVAENWLKSQTFRIKKKGGAEMHPKSKLNCPNILREFKKLIIIFFVMLLKLPEMNLIFDSWEIGLNLFGSSNFEEFHHQ